MSDNTPVTRDAWHRLRNATSARIALGRAGGSLPTGAWLDFKAAHAAARDAVHYEFDAESLAHEIGGLGVDTIVVDSAAGDRTAFLQRPDLGRRLNADSCEGLERVLRFRNEHILGATGSTSAVVAEVNALAEPVAHESHSALLPRRAATDQIDLAIIVSDGLSALAVERHAAPLIAALLPRLKNDGWSLAPVVIARFGRVALEDEVGELLGARIALMLIGERPGLGSPDSLGAYLVYGPRVGNTDASRNCISNIRSEGLAIAAAAETIYYLLTESRGRSISGVNLKDQRVLPAAASRGLPKQ